MSESTTVLPSPFDEDHPRPGPGWAYRLLTTTASGGRLGIWLLQHLARFLVAFGVFLVNPSLLIAIRNQKRFQVTETLVMLTQAKFQILWPAISAYIVCACLNGLGISSLWLGIGYAILLWYLIYTATEDFSWGGAWNLFWFLLAAVCIIALLSVVFQWQVAAEIEKAIEKSGVTFPTPFLGVFALVMSITYGWSFLRRLREQRVDFTGNTFKVYKGVMGGSKTHTTTDYTIELGDPDPNESRLGYYPVTLRPRLKELPTYVFPTVAGGHVFETMVSKMMQMEEVVVAKS